LLQQNLFTESEFSGLFALEQLLAESEHQRPFAYLSLWI